MLYFCYFNVEVIEIEETKGILVFASHNMKEDVEMVEEYYPNIFSTYWMEDFERCLKENFGRFHVVAIACKQGLCRRKLFQLVEESGFQGKVYALVPLGEHGATDSQWPSAHISLQDRFRCFVYNQMNP